MTATGYMEMLTRHNQAIREKVEEIEELLSEISIIRAIDYAKDRVLTSPSDMLAEQFAKLDSLHAELRELVDRRDMYLEERKKVVEAVQNQKARRVIYEYYIVGKRLFFIADDIGMSDRQVKRLKAQGLKEIQQMLDKNVT